MQQFFFLLNYDDFIWAGILSKKQTCNVLGLCGTIKKK